MAGDRPGERAALGHGHGVRVGGEDGPLCRYPRGTEDKRIRSGGGSHSAGQSPLGNT